MKELFLDETIEESLDLEKTSPKYKFDRFHPRKKHVVYPLIEKTCNIEKNMQELRVKMHVSNYQYIKTFLETLFD